MTSVAILGMGFSLFDYVQDFESGGYKRPTDEVWGINSVVSWLNPNLLTMGIALDNFHRDMEMDDGKHKQYVENMVNSGLPILADVDYPEWPNVKAYPLKAVLLDIWPNATSSAQIIPDLENTINFAIALAIHRKFDEIWLYGCDFRRKDNPPTLYAVGDALEKTKPWWFAYHNRQIVQHRRDMEPGEPCTMFLLGIAQERGISIRITHGSTLCNMDRGRYYYGYQYQPDPFNEREQDDGDTFL